MHSESRIKNSLKNVSYSLIVTLINTLVSFATRTYLVKILGTQVLGLNGLFTEVVAMISLAEMGVGMAIIYSLYTPLYEKDEKKISQLMNLYRTAYNVISLLTFFIGIALTPIVHILIRDIDYSLGYIRLIFILFVIKTSTSYLFSYKTSLINADQKQYIVAITNAIAKLVFAVGTIIVLIISKSFVLYLIIQIVQTLVTNIILSKYVDKQYPYLDRRDKLPNTEKKEIFSNIKNIFIKRLSGVITSSTDNILISKLVSTIQVGYYSNYIMIFNVVKLLKQQITNGVAASIGNLMVSEKEEKCIEILRKLTFLFFSFALVMCSGLFAVSDVFIEIWIGKDYVMKKNIVAVAIVVLFIDICADPLWQFLEVSGLFKKDKNIAIFGSVTNLIVSIFLGIKLGIVGIFFGTICSLVIQIILKVAILFKYKFCDVPSKYYFMWGKMMAALWFVFFIQNSFMQYIPFSNIYLEFIVKGFIAIIIATLIVIILFFNSMELKYCLEIMVKKRRVKSKNV